MKIDVITMWRNEAFLAPFFLKHYSFADTIHILYDETTTDNTLEIISKFENVHVIPIRFPEKLDDILKIEMVNSVYLSIECDWVIAVDCDELVFPLPPTRNLRELLQQEGKYNLFIVQMWQIYRHRTDSDLDPSQPAIYQRRHGDPSSGINVIYAKPIIVRSGLGLRWEPGCHSICGYSLKEKGSLGQLWDRIRGNDRSLILKANGISGRLLDMIRIILGKKRIAASPQLIYAAHWQNADPEFAMQRRGRRKDRQSKRNLATGMGVHNYDISEEKVREDCAHQLDDPLLF